MGKPWGTGFTGDPQADPGSCSLAELKELLHEIIDAYAAILLGNDVRTIMMIKKCIRRFRDVYLKEYRLSGGTQRVRIKGRMIVGYICSSEKRFPFSETVYRRLHEHRMTYKKEYYMSHPLESEDFLKNIEPKCVAEINKTLAEKPIESCNDVHRLIEAFDMMVHLAHAQGFDPATSFLNGNWFEINPWRLPKGKSMLIDYWYTVPTNLRPIGHMVLNRLASSEIKTAEDLLQLRREVEKCIPIVDKKTRKKSRSYKMPRISNTVLRHV